MPKFSESVELSKFSDFKDSVEKLLVRMIKQGAKDVGIKKVFKMMGKHWTDFEKFFISAEDIVSELMK